MLENKSAAGQTCWLLLCACVCARAHECDLDREGSRLFASRALVVV